jgi:hypothetical protein
LIAEELVSATIAYEDDRSTHGLLQGSTHGLL